MRFLTTLSLPTPDQNILHQNLAIYNLIHEQIKITTQWVNESLYENRYRAILLSLPGLGEILAALAALEIADIKRFAYPAKLSAYAGLVPTT
jgi:transposase